MVRRLTSREFNMVSGAVGMVSRFPNARMASSIPWSFLRFGPLLWRVYRARTAFHGFAGGGTASSSQRTGITLSLCANAMRISLITSSDEYVARVSTTKRTLAFCIFAQNIFEFSPLGGMAHASQKRG